MGIRRGAPRKEFDIDVRIGSPKKSVIVGAEESTYCKTITLCSNSCTECCSDTCSSCCTEQCKD